MQLPGWSSWWGVEHPGLVGGAEVPDLAMAEDHTIDVGPRVADPQEEAQEVEVALSIAGAVEVPNDPGVVVWYLEEDLLVVEVG